MQLMNNGSVSSSRLELEISTNSRIVQIEPVSQTIFLIRDDKNRFGLLDAKLNVTNWFYFEDIMDFRLMRKGSQEIPKSSSTVKYVNISRSVDGLNISWTVEPVGNESHLFDITFYEPISDQKWKSLLNPEYQPLLESYSTMIKNLTSDSQYSIKYSTNYHSENVYNERFFQFDQIFEWTITAATLPDIYITPKMTNVEIVQKLDGEYSKVYFSLT
uniref:Fibronectin type-III domain-containing protein n=1 Tax=Romanomermis culicivorax TaxID=13658 RepID=A0A915HFV1_ROMCU